MKKCKTYYILLCKFLLIFKVLLFKGAFIWEVLLAFYRLENCRCPYLRGAFAWRTGQSVKGAFIQAVLQFRTGEYAANESLAAISADVQPAMFDYDHAAENNSWKYSHIDLSQKNSCPGGWGMERTKRLKIFCRILRLVAESLLKPIIWSQWRIYDRAQWQILAWMVSKGYCFLCAIPPCSLVFLFTGLEWN